MQWDLPECILDVVVRLRVITKRLLAHGNGVQREYAQHIQVCFGSHVVFASITIRAHPPISGYPTSCRCLQHLKGSARLQESIVCFLERRRGGGYVRRRS